MIICILVLNEANLSVISLQAATTFPARIALFAGLIGLCLAAFAAPAQALSVDSVRLGAHPDKTRMVLELSESADFRVFVLEGPYRIVVDLPAFEWRAGGIEKFPGSPVKEIRTGLLQAGISRLVADVTGPVAVQGAFLLPAAQDRPDRLVIDFAPVSASVFAARKDTILGTLSSTDPRFNLSPARTMQAPAQESRTAGMQASAAAIPSRKPAAEKPLIVIDPGHGGQDPGAVGANRTHEKNVTLAMAQELKRQLEATGRYRVKLTRENDRFIKLHERVAFARAEKGDLFVSLHADSIDKPGVRGASIYTLSDKASDAQTEALAARENRVDLIAGVDLSHEDKDVANILIDLARRDTMNQSKFFANTLVDKMRAQGIKLLDRPHRYAGFAVLKAPDIPSVLVEVGFMSNRGEAEALSSPEYRRKIAGSLAEGIEAYFAKIQKNHRS